jgi:glycosyl transferase family 22 (putative mannosyltransferase)
MGSRAKGRALVARADQAFARHPLLWVILTGATLRLMAAMFSRGFLAADDHHVLVVAADSLASGFALPVGYKRSLLYPLTVSLIMTVSRAVGITSPDAEMLVVRLVHAAYSLLGIALVYRILDRTSSRDSAVLGGLLMATFFPIPVTSVHQLEEAVCQVPLLSGCWWLLRAENSSGNQRWSVLSGVAVGVALILRLQLLSFIAPLFLLVWYRRPRDIAAYWTAGLLLVLVAQGAANAIVNGQWWFSFSRYYGVLFVAPQKVVLESGGYPSGPVWRYALTLLGVFVPPFSLLALAAMVRGGWRIPLLGIPTLGFLVAHSLIANKQERFLLPVLPLLVLLAAAGFPEVRAWFTRRGGALAYRTLWIYFGVIDAALLGVTVFSFGKKDRVAPLVYVERQHDAKGVIIAQFSQTFTVPLYYLGRPRPEVLILQPRDTVDTRGDNGKPARRLVNYIVLYSDHIASDSAALARLLEKPLYPMTTVQPSLTDWLAHRLNPRHNKATVAVVYQTQPRTESRPWK